MQNQDKLEAAFWANVKRLHLSRGTNFTPFGKEVAGTVLGGGILALQDRLYGNRQYRVISAPTGSGESSYASLMAAFSRPAPPPRVSFSARPSISARTPTAN